jgi:hypothetical protein
MRVPNNGGTAAYRLPIVGSRNMARNDMYLHFPRVLSDLRHAATRAPRKRSSLPAVLPALTPPLYAPSAPGGAIGKRALDNRCASARAQATSASPCFPTALPRELTAYARDAAAASWLNRSHRIAAEPSGPTKHLAIRRTLWELGCA